MLSHEYVDQYWAYRNTTEYKSVEKMLSPELVAARPDLV